MTRHPVIISAHDSKYPGDMCVTVGWCCAVGYPDPAWVGFAVGTTIEEAFASLAACSALRAQPASGELLRAVLGELADRPGLVERAIRRCEHFARGNEDDAVNVYAWEKNCTDFDADDRRTNRIAHAAMCRQTARLLRDLVTP